MRNNTIKLAFSSMLAALSTALMFMTNLFPAASYTLPAIAGALMMLTVIELGKRWAWPSFVVSAVLSFLVVADKEAVAIFVLFFGYYPILKANFEQLPKRLFRWLAKFLLFNVAMLWSFSSPSICWACRRKALRFLACISLGSSCWSGMWRFCCTIIAFPA